MSNDKKFGPVADEQPHYWASPEAVRQARLLDQHFEQRKMGVSSNKDSLSNYAIPKSMKDAIRVNPDGGLPLIQTNVNSDGNGKPDAELAYRRAYEAAQERFLQRAPEISKQLGIDLESTNYYPQESRPVQQPQNIQNNGWIDINQQQLRNSLQRQVPENIALPQTQYEQPVNSGLGRMCTLSEGYQYFQPLKTGGFATTMTLAKSAGTIRGVQGKSFEIREIVECYIIDGLESIDLSSIDPNRKKHLVCISIPMQGVALVPREAIREVTQQPGQVQQRQMLIDTRQMPIPQQVQAQNNYRQQQQIQQPKNQNIQDIESYSKNLLIKRGFLKG